MATDVPVTASRGSSFPPNSRRFTGIERLFADFSSNPLALSAKLEAWTSIDSRIGWAAVGYMRDLPA